MDQVNKEIEMRFFLKTYPEKLNDLKFDESDETDEYFMTEEIAREGRLYLRIRSRKGKRVLELKEITQSGRVSNADERLIEIPEGSYETLKQILERVLPFKIVIKKNRRKAKLNDCEICVDDVEDLGRFLEIEGPEQKISESCKILGVDMDSVEDRGGYVQMMLRKIGFLKN